MSALNYIECLKREAELGLEEVLEEAFSLTFGLTKGPCEASEVATLRFQLALQGDLTPETDEILRKVLIRHLEVGKEHAKLWSHPDPDIDALQEAYDRQSQSMARWILFMDLINKSEFSVEAAYQVAFETYEPQALSFHSDKERFALAQLLKNEQQRDLLIFGMVLPGESGPECLLDEDTIYYHGKKLRVSALESNILAYLWDGQPKTASAVYFQGYGKRGYMPEVAKVGKRISDLNNKLDSIWGNAPNHRWIRRTRIQDELAYQLFKPSAESGK